MDHPSMNDRHVDHPDPPESVRELLDRSQPADVVLGVLTLNDKATAPTLVRSLLDGFRRYGPQQRVLVVNCDASSHDGTPDLIQHAVGSDARFSAVRHPVHGSSFHTMSESGVPGRDAAVRLLSIITDGLSAKACLVVDGNMRAVKSGWSELLASPILDKGMDCVLPWFTRNRYDGTLTQTLLAPLTRALYGKRIPYHLGGACAFSGRFIRSTLLSQPWDEEISRCGIDGWIATLAAAERVDVCQAMLGPRVQQGKSSRDLATIIAQAVGCVLHLMERYQPAWSAVKGSVDIPRIGHEPPLGEQVGALHVERMIQGFRQGLRDLVPVWQIVLPEDTFQRVLELGIEETEGFRFPSELWVQIVYDVALAYHDRLLHREHLLKSLTPLYLGYTASLALATRAHTLERVEQELERLAVQFETMKPYLIQRWRWSDE
jgi:hypothetical protein